MDGEAFFDELYSQFNVSFPCYALLKPNGAGFVTEPANDGTAALVVLTDDDLLRRYRSTRAASAAAPVTLLAPEDLSSLVAGLPKGITHVTFDPSRKFHRRYPVTVLGASLTQQQPAR